MATERQKRLANALIENTKADKPKNKTELLISAGYSPETANASTTKVIQQKGVQDVFAEMGFTKDAAAKVVSGIMNDEDEKPEVRLRATDQVFKVVGAYVPDVAPQTSPVIINVFKNPAVSGALANAEEVLKQSLYGNTQEAIEAETVMGVDGGRT